MQSNFDNRASDSLKSESNSYNSGIPNNHGSIKSNSFEIPSISLPKGGGAIKGIEEKFQVNAVTGTSSFSIPLPFSPSRGDTPAIGLSYNSGSGNSPFGLGWQLAVPSITRKTEKRLPEYRDEEESDTFIIAGAEDLVPFLEKQGNNWKRHSQQRAVNGISYTIKRYRPRIEGSFSRIEKWKNNKTGEVHWKTISSSNIHSYYGLTAESRIADPADPLRVFEWMLCRTHDDKGNISLFQYKKEDFSDIPTSVNEKNRIGKCTQLYLKKIFYGVKRPYYLSDPLPTDKDFMFRVVFDYGEHEKSQIISRNIFDETVNKWACRKDAFSNYRAGFEIRTYRRCKRIFTFHCFDELPIDPYLTKSLELIYNDDLDFKDSGKKEPGFSYLVQARQTGYIWRPETNFYSSKSLPEIEISYQQHNWNTDVQIVSARDIVHAPSGLQDKSYLWVDLFSEGISGILTEQSGSLYYKSNLGKGEFSEAMQVSPKPSFTGLAEGKVFIQELKGDGSKYVVKSLNEPKGFFKLGEEEWEPMKNFQSFPNIGPGDPNLRALDLTGDGLADLLITENDSFRWYEGLGEKGFAISKTIYKEIDEERGPAIVFADREQSIFLADMDGDGLTDIVRIRNGAVCYWPNMGYGLFGSKVTMANAPIFDYPESFNPAYLRLADIDGSGTTDIIYLGKNDFRVWMNQNGNEWNIEPHIISEFPPIHNLSDVAVLDFLGSGTACIVYSTLLGTQPIWYIDLMGSMKPHLFTGYQNNCGKEVSIEYKSSSHFYLEDKKEGKKWVTKLPFPVHCIHKTKSEDKIRKTVFTCSYRYSHGYFDHEEREFRGFGRVEQLDTEDFSQFKLNDAKNVVEEKLHQAPVKTISWFHTGAWVRNRNILHQFKEEYFQNTQFIEYNLPDAVIPPDLSAEEIREAYRACKGLPLRVEVYADDHLPKSIFPYTASHSTVEIKTVQPRAGNKYASFIIIPSESVSYGYERNPADPRISQSFVLETDELGNVKKSASVVYPRVARPTGINAVPDKVWEEQNKMHIVYGETLYTNNDILEDNIYRLRTGYESKSYEINGIAQPVDFFFKKNILADNIDQINLVPVKEILFEEDFDGTPQKRLSAHSRGYFYRDDLSGPLPLGELSKLGIAHKSYQLAFTKNLVTKYYGTKVTNQMLVDSKYVHQDDDHWWTQPGDIIFPPNPKDKFYTPIGGRDVFGNESFIGVDKYFFLPEKTTNAIGNFSTAVNDYRTLSPVLLTDPNLNRAAVVTDELGLVIASAVMGKEGAGEGDTLEDPTARMEYDLFNWKNNGKPNFVHMYARELHGAANPRWQESYVYSDGGGTVIMAKAQAAPGKAKRWNTVTKKVEEIDANPRWLGNGRTIFNNKVNPVKQYEPYFSTNFEYESEDALVETGMTPILYYDAVGRNIKTEFPNGTFVKAKFDAWYSKSYDVNDTVKDSKWFADRGSPDPTSGEPANPETRAAWLAAKHYNTPSIAFSDSLGRTTYAITDYGNGKTTSVYSETDLAGRFSKIYDQLGRNVSEGYVNLIGQSIYGKTAENGERWVFTDVMGRLVRIWDNDIREMYSSFDKLHRPLSKFVKEGANEILFGHVVYGDLFSDAEAKAKNMKGRAYQMFDQAGAVTIKNVDFKGNATEVERRLTKEYKQNINWNVLDGITSIPTIKTAAEPFLETEVFSSSSEVDALGRPILVTLSDKSVVQPKYNEANSLDSLKVKIRGIGDFVTFLDSQDYDAKGQRQFAKFGNGTITNYFYDPQTFRLVNLVTKLNETDGNNQSIQNLNYTFDAVGNIVHQRDDAQQTHFFRNAVVYPESKFEYDAIYQLKKATGREHAGLGGNAQRNDLDLPFIQQLPHQNDTTAVRNYIEQYEYDDCGNIKRLQHIATHTNWTTRYKYEYEDDANNKTNRLNATSMPSDADGIFSATYKHDSNGNMTSMPHLSIDNCMKWNFMDQLNEVNLGGGGTAYYVYGLGGNRIRKIIERPGGKKLERIYLGAVEIYRERQNTNEPDLERYTLHISDNTGRIAQVDTKTIDKNGSDVFNLLNANNIRYQYSNHLGSATLETDDAGNVISYEEYHPYGTSAYHISKSDSDLSLKRYRFTGKERDEETGFYYFGARYYAAWLGRWTSSDPAGFVSGLNLFIYCSNNPIMYHDPDGMQEVKWVVPKNVDTIPEFESWAKKKGISYTGTPTYDSKTRIWNIGPYKTVDSGKGGPVVAPGTPAASPTEEPANESPASEPSAESAGAAAAAAGESAVYNNPTGHTLEIPDSTSDPELKVFKQDAKKREIGRNAGRGNSTRVRRNTPAQRQALREFKSTTPQPPEQAPGGRGWAADHKRPLQYDLPGQSGTRPQDYAWKDRVLNDAQGSEGWELNRRNPQGVPAGGVARTSEAGLFWNRQGFRTGMRWGGYGLLGAGTLFSAYSFSQDVSEGNWFGALLNGSGFVGGGLTIGGLVFGAATGTTSSLVAAGTIIGAPAAVFGAAAGGFALGTYTYNNTAISDVAMAGGSVVEDLTGSRTAGAVGAAATAVLTAPVFVPIAVGKGLVSFGSWLGGSIYDLVH